ncbi:MAG TPA: hypothetical protein VE487_02310 [Ilumatobacter sp.]|nr:hypothetical protein [Ilumatobacter sp.]
MTDIDIDAATAFMARHARLLDRRRFDLLCGTGDAASMLGALEGYRNADGGYGWGIEPDLRSPESQPAGALHAFEVFAEAGPETSPRAAELCDWLEWAALPDGGLPFARPVIEPAGCAPFWAGADAETSSLHITAGVCSMAYRVAAHDPDVAAHPWLAAATEYCLAEIDRMSEAPHAIALMYILQFLDALVDTRPEREDTLRRIASDHLPSDGSMHVAGGLEDERLNPLDFSPLPDRPLRTLIDGEAIATDRARWAAGQQDDGGWRVDFTNYSPIAALEWRGYVTVRAISLLTV